ncbi:protease [Roseivivax halodurans JCM 10272]|uniref:Zinc metalloprotease n=1 Tax=Roseivivax halodurans JCM 10272 TaxID=1449350 RepID=X7EL16_9RHOB|nr:site-2 protease family protein [Roseivivax halodurans]ETX16617.1 protease [Roseivivax halodurans JCM 10272]
MSWSFPIGRLLGSELRVHATFFLLLAWIAASAWVSAGPEAALLNTAFILALFACVVAHEFGHALTARRYGIRTPDITLLPIGGLARLERMPEKPWQEIKVALAGPAVNVVIAGLLILFGARLDMAALTAVDGTAAGFAGRLAAVNIWLVVFNLIPAFPMDGGRVLRAGLALFMGRVKATKRAALVGQVIAFGLGFLGLFSGNILLVLVATFVFLAASAENSEVSQRSVAEGLSARDAMITEFERLAPEDTLATAGQALIRTTQHEFPVLAPDGTLAGFLTRDALFRAMAEGERTRPVGEIMRRDIPSVALAAPLPSILDALGSRPAVAVTDGAGRVLGYITRENVGELMMLRRGR